MVTIEDGDEQNTVEGGVEPSTEAKAATPEVDPARRALVAKWLEEVKADEKHHEKAFKRMRTCMKLAANGTTDSATAEAENGDYVVPILNRLINQTVAGLYAKNPKALAKRKDKLLYTLWDGDPASLVQATQAAMPQPVVDPMTGGPAVDPMTGGPAIQPGDMNAMALVAEVQQAKQQMLLYDRMAKTLQLLFAYFLDEQDAGYKEQLKAMVRRAKVCGVAYIDLGFQRLLKPDPDVSAQIADVTSQVKAIEGMLACMQEGEIEEKSAKAEELKLLLDDLQSKSEIIVREGPILSFPRATDIIPDRDCRHLKTFAGSRRLSRRFDMTPDQVRETYGVNVGENYIAYKADTTTTDKKAGKCRLYRVQDKRNQQAFVVCDGYPDFIVPPAAPDVAIERFWTIFPLVLNEIESEDEIFPPSDVWNGRHMQREYNSTRQGKREHRIAGRPGWATMAGKLSPTDKQKLATKGAFEVIELESMTAGEKIEDILQGIPVPGVDPNMYETETIFADVQRSVGAQAANLGGTAGDTATESSIAENSRMSASSSDVDDLDTLLSALARAMGQLMLTEISKETVLEIAGPGAVWPDAPPTREQVVKDLVLMVEAGSSGRPNQAAELANFERAMPYLTLLPGVNPMPLAKKGLGLLNIDLEEAIVEGQPSIQALNQMAGKVMQQAGAGPDSPDQQGGEGANNAPGPEQRNEPQSQPEYTAPGPGVPSG